MLLDVPLIPDKDYIRFLNVHRTRIYSVHFSLYQADVLDARYKLRLMSTDALAGCLKGVPTVLKYLLLNSRIHNPAGYSDKDTLAAIMNTLAQLNDAGLLDGIIYADAYFLQALSDTTPDIARKLEAVPSINCMLDSFEKIRATFDILSSMHFKPPQKIILYRGLNRRPEALSGIAAKCRENYTAIKLGLLANEGCIYQCPYKPAHDALLAIANMNMDVNTHDINQSLGCIRYFLEKPQAIFKSPFIRPEDMQNYEGIVDIIKICGRTLGRDFLERTIQAYAEQRYKGNLLDLMDSLDWMSDEFHVENGLAPPGFF